MNKEKGAVVEVSGLYQILPLQALRRTPQVVFDVVPAAVLSTATAVDRVLHEPGAMSPGPVGNWDRPWYMHPHQDDNLLVLYGKRYVDIYSPAHGKVEHFRVTPHEVEKNGRPIVDAAAILGWPRGVFHRITSDSEEGSASLNFAVRYEGFDIRTNFNIYGLNTTTGEYDIIREGHLDQLDHTT